MSVLNPILAEGTSQTHANAQVIQKQDTREYLLDMLKERMDHTMVHASLNQELVKEKY